MFMLVLALVSLAICAVRTARERRRLSNGVFLLFGLAFLLLWLFRFQTTTATVIAEATLLVLIPLLLLVLALALIVNGFTMLSREGLRPANVLSPVVGTAMIGLAGMFLLALYLGNRWFILSVTAVTLVAVYVAFLFTSFLLYAILYSRIRYTPGPDAIVVLGSGLFGDRVPPLLASRLDRAATVYRREIAAGFRPVIVASGGQGPGEDIPESVAMARYLHDAGIPWDALLTEQESTTTMQNLLYSRDLLLRTSYGDRMVVVTNNFHAFRAAMWSRRAGVTADVVGSRTAWYYLPNAILREYFAVFLQYRWINISICAVLAGLCFLALLGA